ncbi:MAG: hypothetical protein M1457_04400 [bacterium]|nr:hypothetical protein [bacterium]
MAAGIVAAYGVAVWGVGRDRRGDAQGLVALRTLWARWRAGRPWRTAPFASPARALFWAECRQKLYFMPLAIGVFGFFFVLLGALRVSRPPEMLELLLGVVVFGPLYGAFFFGLLLGRSGGFGRRARIDTFTATLPVPDRRLSAAVLKTGVTSLLLTWAIGAVWIGIVCQALWAIGEGDTVRHVWREIGLADHSFRELSAIVTLGVTSAWALLAIGTTLTLTGRPAAIGVVAAFIILGLVLPAFAALGGEHVARVYVEILSVGTIAFWLLGTFAAYAVALRRGHVGAGLAFSALALWLALTAWLLFDVSAKGNIHWPGLLALLAFAAAVLSPPAAAPLALAWNRHR